MGNKYRVIEILDDKSVLINYGRNHGANEGKDIRVIAIGPEVRDPETDRVLGTLDHIKATLTIEVVYENFSLCKNIEITSRNTLMSPLSQFQSITKSIKKLNVNEDSITNKKPPEDYVINVGDIVETI